MAGSDDSWTPPSARPIEDDSWTPPSARPLHVYTGKEERAAEEKKLVEGLNPLERAAVGAGHGMRNVDLNIRDIMGRVPGLGGRPDPEAWRDEEQIYGRTLGGDTAAGVGDLTGQTAMLAPVGGGGGAVVRTLLPRALAAAAPVLVSGGEGAAMNALAAGPGKGGEGAATGFGLGAMLPLAGRALTSALPQALKGVGAKAAQWVLGGNRAGVSADAAEQALKEKVIRFFGTSHGAAERAEQLVGKLGGQYREVLKTLAAQGVEGPEASAVADRWLQQAIKEETGTLGSTVPDLYMKHAEDVAQRAGESGRIPLMNSRAILQDLQGRANYNPTVDKATNDARKSLAYGFRDELEKAIAEQAPTKGPEAETAASQFLPVKRKLRLALEAAEGAQKGARPGLTGHLMDLGTLMSTAQAGLHHGGLTGALTSLPITAGEHLLRTRGPSSIAAMSYGLGSGLESLAPREAQLLADAPVLTPTELQLPSWQTAIAQALRRRQETP